MKTSGNDQDKTFQIRDFFLPLKVIKDPIVETLDLSKPIDIEIGCGVGWHSIQYSKQNPNRQLIAIEHTQTKFEKFKRRCSKHTLKNLIPIHGNAISWITHNIPENSIHKYFLFYPNPNPKGSDKSKRWHCMPFMKKILQTLRPGGTITLCTNQEFYHLEALDYFTKAWNLKLLNSRKIKSPFPARTHFEKKFLERGETCFESNWRL